MFTLRQSLSPHGAHSFVIFSRQMTYLLLISAVMILGLSGCGQKGELYLADAGSQTLDGTADVLQSTSHPQDAAFASIDDDGYDRTRYLEEQQVLPEPSDDPNDY